MTLFTYKKADITTAEERVIIHGCNAQGVMGAGVALAIRRAFPKAYKDYRDEYEKFGLRLGDVIWSNCDGRMIGNAITQNSYGRKGLHLNYDALDRVMHRVGNRYNWSFHHIAMPKIGAGLAGGDWDRIAKIIEAHLDRTRVVIYELE